MSFLQRLRTTSMARSARWHGPDSEPWTGADWSNAMCGEAGEAANVVKKIRRIETRTGSRRDGFPFETLQVMLGNEIADTVVYGDRLAAHYDIDLTEAIVRKFNFVSDQEGFPERLPTFYADKVCHDCHGSNPVWYADNDLWNFVIGNHDNPRGEGVVLCPTCFGHRVDAVSPTAVLRVSLDR